MNDEIAELARDEAKEREARFKALSPLSLMSELVPMSETLLVSELLLMPERHLAPKSLLPIPLLKTRSRQKTPTPKKINKNLLRRKMIMK